MKRTLFLAFILLLISLVSAEEDRWFRSNSSGMPLEEIGRFRLDEFDWVLRIENGESDELRTLFKKDEIFSRRQKFFMDEELIREIETEENMVTEYLYQDGLITRETRNGSGPEERRDYFYRGRMVERIELYLDGELSYEDRYYLDSRGRLIRVQRSFPGEEDVTARYGYHGSELKREWHKGNDREELFLFDGGEVVSRSNWIEGRLDLSEKWEEIDGESVLVIRYPGEDRIVYRRYDESERLVSEIILEGDDQENIEYRYADDDLIEKILRGRGRKERWEYQWRDGELYSEKFFRNTAAVRKLIYPSEGIRWELTYRNGEVLASVIYENDIPVETLFGIELEEELEKKEIDTKTELNLENLEEIGDTYEAGDGPQDGFFPEVSE